MDIYKKWALNAVHSGNRELLIEEINKIIDSKQFLPDYDYLCYAYGSEDSNEFKYARISLLEAKIADSFKIKWDLLHQGMLNCNSYITWARFRYIEELRKDLISKFKQMVYKFPSANDIANVFTEIIKVILDLSDKIIDSETDTIRYKRGLAMINSNDREMIIKELLKYIQNDSFLVPIPTNNISL